MAGSDIGETKRKDCVSLQSVKGKAKNRLTAVIHRNERLVWTKTEETTGAAITIMAQERTEYALVRDRNRCSAVTCYNDYQWNRKSYQSGDHIQRIPEDG